MMMMIIIDNDNQQIGRNENINKVSYNRKLLLKRRRWKIKNERENKGNEEIKKNEEKELGKQTWKKENRWMQTKKYEE